MSADRLERFRDRTSLLLEETPPQTKRETRTIVEELLWALGWDTRVDCRTDVTLDGTTIDYVCGVDSLPALVVAVESADRGLDPDRLQALGEVMVESGVDRGLYTNGQVIQLMAGTTPIETHQGDLRSPATLEILAAEYHERTLADRLQRHDRRHVARRFVFEREQVHADVLDVLTAVAGDAYRGELEQAVDGFLEDVTASFRTDDTGASSGQSGTPVNRSDAARKYRFDETETADSRPSDVDDASRAESEPETSDVDSAQSRSQRRDSEDVTDSDTPTNGNDGGRQARTEGADEDDHDTADTVTDAGTDEADGEYVVRFFGDHGSVGAIGHSSSAGALVHAAEFLFERGLSGVRLPWPSSEAAAVDNGVGADEDLLVGRTAASVLVESRQLSNGIHLNVGGSEGDHVARLEALASRAGYRVMLTGDWEETGSARADNGQ